MANGPHYAKGRYVGRVLNQGLGKASTGTPQFVLQIKVLGKVDPENPSNYIPDPDQYERTVYRAITEKTMEYVAQDLKTLGFAGTSFRMLDPSTDGFHDFRGLEADFFCNHENGQDGTPREKWGVARVAGEFSVETLEPAKMRELDNLFGKQLKAGAAAGATKQKPQPAAVAAGDAEITDDDIPF